MANIIDKVAQIRNAELGKDVRETIASGIESINTEVVSTTARQAVVEGTIAGAIEIGNNPNLELGESRGTFDTLKKRLDNSDSQLAEIPQQIYITEKAKQVDLDIANANIALKREKTVKLALEDMSDAVISAITGGATLNVLSKPQDNSVGVMQSQYPMARGTIPKNLFNKDTITSGKYIAAMYSGVLTTSGFSCASDYMKLLPTTSYAIKYFAETYNNDIAFFDADKVYITGIANIVNGTFTTPSNCVYARISVLNTHIDTMQVELGTVNTTYDTCYPKTLINDGDITSNGYWKDKKVVWFGTSIPAGANGNGGAYPNVVAEKLGFTVFNECVAGSSAYNTIGGGVYPFSLYALSTNLAEKNYAIDNWATEKSKYTGAPDTLTEEEKTLIRNSSYEIKLIQKYLIDTKCDLYVFDHGRNDYVADNPTVPVDAYDRSKFIGAINFLVKTILTSNPKARIAFISHYEIDRLTPMVQAQQIIADYWRFPFLKLYEKLGWSQRTINTNGYWGVDGIWVESGGALQTLTMTQIALKDDLHPASDNSGKAVNLIAGFVEEFIKGIK